MINYENYKIFKKTEKDLRKKYSKEVLEVYGKILAYLYQNGYSIDADTDEDVAWVTRKVLNLRIFDDENGVMNRSCIEVEGEILVVSQFTLQASTKKGNRPSYIKASKPDVAIPMYEAFCEEVGLQLGKPVQTGTFGADMKVELLNDGPVTILIDSQNKE